MPRVIVRYDELVVPAPRVSEGGHGTRRGVVVFAQMVLVFREDYCYHTSTVFVKRAWL